MVAEAKVCEPAAHDIPYHAHSTYDWFMKFPTAVSPRRHLIALLMAGLLSACGADKDTAHQTGGSAANQADRPAANIPLRQYQTIEWVELMPEDDLDALLNPPAYLDDIEDGSMEDQIDSQIQNAAPATGKAMAEQADEEIANAIAQAEDDRYQQALVSTRIKPEFDGRAIRIPGFIVPLAFDDKKAVTEFFIVPYFGACIHLPPPPPNQIIHASYPSGLELDSLYDAFWISGTLATTLTENTVATSAYSMSADAIEIYTE